LHCRVIAPPAVAIERRHGDLLALAGFQHGVVRFNLQASDAGAIRRGRRGTCGNPSSQYFIGLAVRFHAPAAAVWQHVRRFGEQQAVVGGTRRYAPAAAALGDLVVVPSRIEAEQRQFESVLATGLAVAAPRVAAITAEQRDNLALKIDRPRLLGR
jgi:hypothetical protein